MVRKWNFPVHASKTISGASMRLEGRSRAFCFGESAACRVPTHWVSRAKRSSNRFEHERVCDSVACDHLGLAKTRMNPSGPSGSRDIGYTTNLAVYLVISSIKVLASNTYKHCIVTGPGLGLRHRSSHLISTSQPILASHHLPNTPRLSPPSSSEASHCI